VKAKPLCPSSVIGLTNNDLIECQYVRGETESSPCILSSQILVDGKWVGEEWIEEKWVAKECNLPELKNIKIEDSNRFYLDLYNPVMPVVSFNGILGKSTNCIIENPAGVRCTMLSPVAKMPMIARLNEYEFDVDKCTESCDIPLSSMDDAIVCDDQECILMVGVPGKTGFWQKQLPGKNTSLSIMDVDGEGNPVAIIGINAPEKTKNNFKLKGSMKCNYSGAADALLCTIARPETGTVGMSRNKNGRN